MINFESDYTEGCIPEILKALEETNNEQTTGYGVDPHCDNAKALIKKAFKASRSDVHFVVGGTQANVIVLAAILRGHQGAVCAESGHINVHETGALEATGHKCLGLPSKDGKIYADQVEAYLKSYWANGTAEHMVQPGAVYISWPTETGTIYSKQEMEDLHKVCKKYNIPLFCDGARMGYGLAASANDMTPADFTKLTDVFYIGGTKVGALFGEAIVINNNALKKDFRYYIKRHGAMLAKGRLLGIQFETLFTDGKYFEISKNAMDKAEKLTKAFNEKGYEFAYKPQSNQLFVIMDNKKIKTLRKKFKFQDSEYYDETHTVVRFVTSFMTTEENTQKLIKAL